MCKFFARINGVITGPYTKMELNALPYNESNQIWDEVSKSWIPIALKMEEINRETSVSSNEAVIKSDSIEPIHKCMDEDHASQKCKKLGEIFAPRLILLFRLPARLLDSVFLFVINSIIYEFVNIPITKEQITGTIFDDKIILFSSPLFLITSWLYFSLFESTRFGATPGKVIFGLKVCSLEGIHLSFLSATKRYFSKLFSWLTLGLGFLIGFFEQEHLMLHDQISKSTIVKTNRNKDDYRLWLTFLVVSLIYIIVLFYRANEKDVVDNSLLNRDLASISLDNDFLTFSTDGIQKAAGLNLEFDYPSDWIIREGRRPHIIANFEKFEGKNSIILTLFIDRYDYYIGEEETKQLLSTEFISSAPFTDKVFSHNENERIEGYPCSVSKLQMSQTTAEISHTAIATLYRIIYKDYLIQFNFACSNSDQDIEEIEKFMLQHDNIIKQIMISVIIQSNYKEN